MSSINRLIDFQLKIKHSRLQLIFLFLFWAIGFTIFSITETGATLLELILYSLTIRCPAQGGDFCNFYTLVWPILLEVIFFGFIMGELMEKYNPVVSSKILAQHQRNHTIIIGYRHLGERIIEHCIENKKSFSLIEDDQELVEDLISAGKPVVVGDASEESNLVFAGIKKAKEVFICINDARLTIIVTQKIRKYNPNCKIYARIYEEHVQELLKAEPLNAYPFSMSTWAMDGVKEWANGNKGDAIIVGRDRLSHKIAHYISHQEGRNAYLFDDENEGTEFIVNENFHQIYDFARYISDFRKVLDMNKISQVFICWKRDTEFDESIYLASKLSILYPNIEVFVRIFDEELIDLVNKYNAKTFSSSTFAFHQLQKMVPPDSAIAIASNK